MRVEGRANMLANIDAFHARLPGATFKFASGVDGHHGMLRFRWIMFNAQGAPQAEGPANGCSSRACADAESMALRRSSQRRPVQGAERPTCRSAVDGSRRRDSNPRPMLYESIALPLSYVGWCAWGVA